VDDLRRRTIRIAHANPVVRPYLLELLTDRVAMEFDTQEAMDKYLKDHPGADKSKHTVKDVHGDSDDGDPRFMALEDQAKLHTKHILFDDFADAWKASKGAFSKLVESVKPTSAKRKDIVDNLKKASESTRTFFSNRQYRRKKMGELGKSIKNGAKAIGHRIMHAAKAEVHEIGVGVKALKQVLTPGAKHLDKKQKKALYGLGAYVAGASMTLAGAGALMATAAVGKSFALHVGIKAVSHLADSFFTHFEWGVEGSHILHGVGHVMSHLASSRTSADSDADQQAIMEALVLSVSTVLSDGMSDEDVDRMLSGAEDDAYDDVSDIPAIDKLEEKAQEKGSGKDKKASLRGRTIRLAHARPDLRPHLLAILRG
jgi:hypothetical protein